MTINRHFISRLLLFLLLLAILLFATGALLAQIRTQSDDLVEVADILPDMAFFAAGDLLVSAKSTDDVFAAGGDVSLDGAQADHMIAAGGDVIVTNAAFNDLIIAGGNINLVSGSIADDVVAAGGDLDVKPDFDIKGSLVITGGDVSIGAPVGGELRAAAGHLRLNANVAGDAHLVGDDVTIGPNVQIGGDLRHRTRKLTIDPSATVSGEIIELEPAPRPDMEKWGATAAAAVAVFALAFLIGMAVLIVVIALALPSLMNSTAAMIREKPLSTLGIGFLIVVAAPIVIMVLFASVFGAPLALLIGVIFIAAAPLAIAAFAYFVGMLGRNLISKNAEGEPGVAARMGWSFAAATLLVIVGLIPLAGGLLWIIAYVLGIGAVMTRGGKALALNA